MLHAFWFEGQTVKKKTKHVVSQVTDSLGKKKPQCCRLLPPEGEAVGICSSDRLRSERSVDRHVVF